MQRRRPAKGGKKRPPSRKASARPTRKVARTEDSTSPTSAATHLDDGVAADQHSQTNGFSLEALYNSLPPPPRPPQDAPQGLRSGVAMYAYQKASMGQMYRQERSLGKPGGILCEEMGTGKTLICIALILMTKGTQCTPVGNHKIYRAHRNPSKRLTVLENLDSLGDDEQETSVLSLKALAGSLVKCATGAQLERMNLPEELREFIQALPSPFILYDPQQKRDDARGTPGRSAGRLRNTRLPDAVLLDVANGNLKSKGQPTCLRVYLSASTLIVVPATLLDQWIQEFHKYTIDGFLSILVISSSQEFPSPEELSKYDVVLTTHTRISKERCSLNGFSGFSEKCFCDFGVKSTTCKNCQTYRPVSPLMQVYWLRLIIDEGHVMGKKQTNQSNIATNLLSERRWACTGTPTPGLLLDTEMEHLFGLLTFLGYEPFCKRSVWAEHIIRPLRKGDPAAEHRLRDILSQVMIKNKQADIDNEITLPRCHINVVKLQLNHSERQKYNEIVAQIKTNLIASRGSGPDSFLHPANRKYAQRALTNLILYCFHFTSLDKEQRELCLSVAYEQLKDPKLRAELSHGELAALEAVVEIMVTGDPSLDPDSLLPSHLATSQNLNTSMLNTDAAAQNSTNQRSAIEPSDKMQLEHPSPELLRALRLKKFCPEESSSTGLHCEELLEDMDVKIPSSSSTSSAVPSSPPVESHSIAVPSTPVHSGPPSSSDEANTPIPGLTSSPLPSSSSSSASSLLMRSELPEATYIPLSDIDSIKLTYLLERLQELPEGSKAIIFSQFLHVLLILRQALRHIGLPFCEFFYGSHTSPAARASALTTFNTSDNIKAIIMQTELAAFGINLTAASHVFFVDQVWDPSIERQAIKRAHRIGQTREVFVEKLVMENTIEDTILAINQDKTLVSKPEASKKEVDMKAQRKVHSLLKSLQFIGEDDDAPAETSGFVIRDQSEDYGLLIKRRRVSHTEETSNAQNKGKEKDIPEEQIDNERKELKQKPKKRVRFLEPDEAVEGHDEELATYATSSTSSVSEEPML